MASDGGPRYSQNDNHYSPYEPLKIKNFRYFLLGRFFTTFAWSMQAVIVGWQIYELTKDPLAMGTTGLAEIIPFFVVILWGGHVADILSRKMILITCCFLLMLCALFLFYLTTPWGLALKQFGVIPIWMAIGVTGVVRGFIAPATNAFFAQILPKELYAKAIAWNSNVFQCAAVAGPMVGGLVYGFAGVSVAYFVVSLFFLGAFFCFPLISGYRKIEKKVEKVSNSPSGSSGNNGNSNGNMFKGLMDGVYFVFQNQLLLGAMSLDLFAVLFGGAISMLPIFADTILHVGPQGLGVLRAAPFIGSVLMGFYLAHHPLKENAGKKLLFSVAGFGVATICFAISTNFYLSLFFLALSGAFDNVSVIIRSTIMQLYTPDHMRGRVSAVNSVFIGSSNEIGAFESGVAAKFMGLVPSVLFGGVMTLVVVWVTAKKAPALRKLNLSD